MKNFIQVSSTVAADHSWFLNVDLIESIEVTNDQVLIHTPSGAGFKFDGTFEQLTKVIGETQVE